MKATIAQTSSCRKSLRAKDSAPYLCSMILLLYATVFCTTYTWTGAGANTKWSTLANWNPNTGYPGKAAADIAVFNATSNSVQLDASYLFANIQISNTYTGNFDFNGKTLTLNTPTGNITFDLGSPGVFQNVSSPSEISISISNNRNFVPPARALTLPDIILQDGSTGSNRTLTQSTNELVCNSLTVSGTTGTRTPIYSANALAFKAGALTVDSGTFTGGGAAGHDTITGNVILSPNAQRGGTLTLPTGLGTGFFVVGGNLTVNAGTYTSTNGTAKITGAWSMPTTATATMTTGSLTAGSWSMAAGTFSVTTGTVTTTNGLSVSGGTFTVSSTGAVTVGGDISLSGGTFKESSTGTINAGGNWSNTGGTFTCGTGTVVFNGSSGPYTITPNGNSFYKLQFNNSSGTWNLSGSTTTGALFTMTAGTLNVGSNSLTCNAGLTAAGGTINASTGNVAVTGAVTLSGTAFSAPGSGNTFFLTANFAKTAGTFTHNNGTLTLAGTATTNTITTNTSTDLYNIAITGAGTYTVNSGLKFNNFSMATNGKLTIGTGQSDTALGTLTVTNGSLVLNATASLSFPGNANLSAIKLITSTASSQFVFYGASGIQQLTQPTIAMTLPAIVHTGAGTLQFQNAITCKGLTQSGDNGPGTSVLDFNGKNLTMASGNFAVSNGTATTLTGLGGTTILVTAGNANFYGTSTLNHLVVDGTSNWYIDVPTTYTLYALNCDIGHSFMHTGKASGTAVLSTNLGTNGATPPDWIFSTINVWHGTNSTSWTLGTNWSLSHSPASTEDAQFDNTAIRGCVLDMTTTIKNLTFLSTFAQNFSFGTTANVLTVGGTTANFGMGAAATTTLGTGTLSFAGSAAQVLIPPPLASQTLPAISVTSGATNPLSVSTNGLNCGDLTLTASSVVLSTPATTNRVVSITGTGASTLNLGSATILKANGSTVDFSNIALTSDVSDSLDFNGSSTQTFSPASQTFPNIKHDGNAKLAVTPTAAWTANTFTQNGSTSCSFDLGGKDLTTTDDFTITNGNTGSFASGALSGRTITVGGDASLNGTSFAAYLDMDAASSGWYLKVTGACNASYAHIAYCDASSSAGTATLSQDLISTGANTNWTFIANWVSSGASTWGTAASWNTQQVPTLLTNATFDNNGLGNCQLSAPTTVKALTMTNLYTGTLNFNSQSLTITQGADFTTGGSLLTTGASVIFSGIDAGSYLFIPDSGMSVPSLTKSGADAITVTNFPITVTSSFSLTGGTWNWGSGLTSTLPSIATSGGSMNFGSSNVRVTTGNVSLSSCASVSSSGGSLSFLSTGGQTLTPLSSATLPKIYVTGGGKLTLGGVLSCAGLCITMSQFDFSTFSPLTITGDVLSASGTPSTFLNLGGKAISVAGRATFSGSPGALINLNAAAWTITTTDSLFASYADIANSTAGASMRGKALYGCVDDGGNSNWDFSQFARIWHQGGLGSISSGISTEGGTIYLAITGTPDSLYCRSSSDGSVLWGFPGLGSGTISQPEYYYSSSTATYDVAFTTGTTGNQLVILQDNGMQCSQLSFSPITLNGSNAGDPMVTPDQSAICVTSNGHVTEYSLTDGHQIWDASDQANISPGADLSVFSANIYDVTNDGKLEKRDLATGNVIALWSGGASAPMVDYPFEINDNIAYITGYSGSNGKLFAVDITNLSSTKWTWGMNAVAAAPLFSSHGAAGAWVANGKYMDKVVNGAITSPGWEFVAPNKITGGPVAMNNGSGPVYFSTNAGDYYAVNDGTGAIFSANWPVHTSGSSTACTPWVDIFTWKVIFGTANGNLDALPIGN